MKKEILHLLTLIFLFFGLILDFEVGFTAPQVRIGTGLEWRNQEQEGNVSGFSRNTGLQLEAHSRTLGVGLEYQQTNVGSSTSQLEIQTQKFSYMLWAQAHPYTVRKKIFSWTPYLEAGLGWVDQRVKSSLNEAQSVDTGRMGQQGLGIGNNLGMDLDKNISLTFILGLRAYRGGFQSINPSYAAHLGVALGIPVFEQNKK